MNEFFLNIILDDNLSNKENIIKILKARGFFIDCYNNNFYLSDNASIDDIQYLDKSLREFQIGKLIDSKEYVKVNRRIWKSGEPSRSYSYNTIQHKKVEIKILEDASIEKAIMFFHSKDRIGMEGAILHRNWSQFIIESMGTKVPVEYLESYVSLYVKAISACGVYPNRSCDGNHEKGGIIYVYADFPSSLWHEHIWNYIIQREFGPVPYIGDGIPFDENNQREIYKTIYDIANYLYKHRKKIRELKIRCVKGMTKKYLKKHTDEEIEAFFSERCKRVLSDVRL